MAAVAPARGLRQCDRKRLTHSTNNATADGGSGYFDCRGRSDWKRRHRERQRDYIDLVR